MIGSKKWNYDSKIGRRLIWKRCEDRMEGKMEGESEGSATRWKP